MAGFEAHRDQRDDGVATRPANLTIMLLFGLPSAMTFAIMMPILKKVGLALGGGAHDEMMVRLAYSIVGVSMFLGSFVSGAIVDRIGSRWPLAIGTILWIGCGLLSLFVSDVRYLIVLRFAVGFSAATVQVAGTAMLGAIAQVGHRARLAGYNVTVAILAAFGCYLVAGALADIDWRYPFLLHLAAVPLLIAIFARPLAAHVRRPSPAIGAGQWREFPFGLAVLGFVAGTVTFVTAAYMPFRFNDIGVTSGTAVGVALAVSSILPAVSSAAFGRCQQMFGYQVMFAASFIVAGIGTVLSAVFDSYWPIVIGLVVKGIGVGPMLPNLYSQIAGAAPAARGRLIGIVKGIHYGAAFAGTAALEPIMRYGGTRAALIAVAALCLAAAIASMIVRPFQPLLAGHAAPG